MNTIRATMTARLLGEASGPLSGIYIITHRATGKRYVGQSVDIARRWKEHRKGDGHSPKFSAALKKHGPDAFNWEIVELCAREELDDRECFYIFAFDCLTPKGYNIGTGGEGVTWTPEVRAKHAEAVRLSNAALWSDPEFRARQAEAVRRLHSDPEWQARNAEAVRRIQEEPDFQARRLEGVRRATSSPEWRARNRDHLDRLRRDPDREARRLDALRRANRQVHADPVVYRLVHEKTGAAEQGTRLELRERLSLNPDCLGLLVRGKIKTSKGWRLARPEENK